MKQEGFITNYMTLKIRNVTRGCAVKMQRQKIIRTFWSSLTPDYNHMFSLRCGL